MYIVFKSLSPIVMNCLVMDHPQMKMTQQINPKVQSIGALKRDTIVRQAARIEEETKQVESQNVSCVNIFMLLQ